MKKILLVGTSGGHLTEVLTLFSEISDGNKIVFSEASPRLKTLSCKTYSQKRYPNTLLHMTLCGIKSLYIILKERPDWVITTGAECGTSAIIAGKMLFRKTMFIETASRYRTKTMSAKICYPLVDKFYVQHRESLEIFGKKAEYIGGVL